MTSCLFHIDSEEMVMVSGLLRSVTAEKERKKERREYHEKHRVIYLNITRTDCSNS